MQPARNFLSEIHFVTTFAEFFDLHRFEPFHHPVGRTVLGDELPFGRFAQRDRLPGRVIESRSAPPRLFAAGVVLFARIDPVGDDRAFGRFPRPVAQYHVLRSVRIGYMQFPEKAGRPERHYPMDLRIVETVAENRSEHVFAAAHPVGHVVSDVHHPVLPEIILDRDPAFFEPGTLAVIGLVRSQHVVADFFAVHIQLEITEAGSVEVSRSDLLIHAERLAQQRGRGRHILAQGLQRLLALPRRADPAAFPLRRIEDTHIPAGRFAPRRYVALPVPHAHPPPAGLARLQRLSRIFHQRGLRTFYFPAVPQIGRPVPQRFFGRGHLDLVCPLLLAAKACGSGIDPRQAGMLRVYDRRVGLVFAGQLSGNDSGASARRRRRAGNDQTGRQ